VNSDCDLAITVDTTGWLIDVLLMMLYQMHLCSISGMQG
jgi:hypothetical protein